MSKEKTVEITGGVAKHGDTVNHTVHGKAMIQFSEELGWHYVLWGYAGFDKSLSELSVCTKEDLD